MTPDHVFTRFKSNWKYVIQRFAGGSYTLQAIENQGQPIDGEKPRRFVNLHVYSTEADADDMMKNMIQYNPDGTMDQAIPYWKEVEIDEADTIYKGSPVVKVESIRKLQREESA